jgi:D-inositol-3-phosphate glycosyltransferase
MVWWDSLILERLAGRGKVCVANSERVADEVRRLFGYRCDPVWFPLDLERFRPGDEEPGTVEQLVGVQRRPIALFVGLGRPMKGAHAALAAAQLLPDVTWLMLGTLDPWITEPLPPNVAVRPPVNPDFMPVLLRSVDVVVMPSLYEPVGTVAAEALACGTPVVAAPSGAADLMARIPELRHYILADPRNPVALAQTVARVVVGGDEVKKMFREAGPAAVAHLDAKSWVVRFLKAVADFST